MSFFSSILNLLRFNNRNWKAVLLCVFAAAVFWLFNALNKNYSANISFPLSFDYHEELYIPVKRPPENIKLNVSGLGWDLLRKSSGLKVTPLHIPLENPADVKKIVGASLPPLLSAQLEGIQINFVLTDTIHLSIDPLVKRRVLLAVERIDENLKKDFGLASAIQIEPDSIWLEGPLSLLNSLQDRLFISLPQNIDKSFSDRIEVELPHESLTANPPLVSVSFGVDRFVQLTDTARLQVINIPKELKTAIEVTGIPYTYRIPSGLEKAEGQNQVTAIIDLADLGKGHHKLIPRLEGLNEFAILLSIDTLHVSF
ncbi:MAG: hypothetical protein KF687_03170 [Cyclobacteriaceae bacterium]|nr:hypothetical protein [Cyclobacteriaceae bacterium]